MDFGAIVTGLAYVAEHKEELAKDAEIGIHFIRRVEHLVVHHRTTADTILKYAEEALDVIAQRAEHPDYEPQIKPPPVVKGQSPLVPPDARLVGSSSTDV